MSFYFALSGLGYEVVTRRKKTMDDRPNETPNEISHEFYAANFDVASKIHGRFHWCTVTVTVTVTGSPLTTMLRLR